VIPEGRLSSATVRGQLLNPWSRDRKISYQWGPVQVQDPSQGLLVKLWTLRAEGTAAVLSAAGSPTVTVFTRAAALDNVSLAFDQNGRPCVCFEEEGTGDSYLYWFDPVPQEPTFMPIPGDSVSPRITLDDARQFNIANSDVILGYVRAGVVRYRRQRDRFQDEYTPTIGDGGSPATATALHHISMNSKLRLEFLTDGGGEEPWELADVIADLLRRSDVQEQHIDVRNLYGHTVEGYRIANQSGADKNIEPLQAAWFFDPGEWDKKLHFVMRGSEPVAHLTYDDLLERHEDRAFKTERVQEIELLRKVNVTMIDSTAGWIPNKQTAERRSATIKAVGEASSVLPITAKPDFTATVALKRLRVPWGEPHKFSYALGTPWSALTATDVVTYTDQRGRKFVMRLAQLEEDYGRITMQANSNATWVYKQTAIGTAVPPSIPTVPAQAGDTVILPLDIPVLRDQDDELGYYIAPYGTGEGWGGGLLQISLDGGATVLQSLDVTVPASVGETVTALVPEVSSEYLSDQVLRITIPETPESISYAELLRYRNLAAVQRADGSWEVLQWQTATQVSENVYDLSGLMRGRYATSPDAVAAGAAFVILDASVLFVQVQQWMVGQTISYRGITYHQNADDVPWESFVATSPKSQEEWPVHYVRAERDGSDNVTVSWIGRARLGVEVSPHHSKYFGGYRVMFSDGFTADTASMTYTRASTPPGVTITVAPINTITGLGPASEGITV